MASVSSLFRFVALSTAVHADAVQCGVEDQHNVARRILQDEEQLTEAETELSVLLERQQRSHVVNRVVSSSKLERERAARSLLQDEQQRGHFKSTQRKRIQSSLDADEKRTPTHLADRQGEYVDARQMDLKQLLSRAQYAVSAEEYEEGKNVRLLDADRGEIPGDSVDKRVLLQKEKIRLLEQNSIKSKLLKLERRKSCMSNVNAVELGRKYIENFRFSDCVESLWDRSGSAAVVDHTNLDLLLSRATHRSSGRVADAVTALVSSDLDTESDPKQLYGCLLYSSNFEAPSNHDTAAVQMLQDFGGTTLAEYYRRKVGEVEVAAPVEVCSTLESVLSDVEHCALPHTFPFTRQFCGLDVAASLLPPARQILTPRFSYASTEELNSLVDVQCKIQELFIDALINDAELVRTSFPSDAPSRDVVAADARLSLAAGTPGRQQHGWITLSST
ncbi:hypothetical protein, conserved [Angomonas deanei]|uniref:Uncharacterized protein n=1 Tax=Angomonas deanei TaxID=59799 RepID=A0A7G2C7H2_9TRYP|nr:hypothetical protein, conserved [Angomonas deanei]